MARGRHRHAPLHRVAVPAGVGGFAALCAATALFVGGAPTWLLRLLAVLAALSAVVGAILLRAWDSEAGRRVAKERAAGAALSWRLDERQAELEEAQELVASLEEKVRAKRAELGRLRGEHADLLRRYARAENDRAHALEGRRRLALEAARPVPVLEGAAGDTGDPADVDGGPECVVGTEDATSGAPGPGAELYRRALSALNSLTPRTASSEPVRRSATADAERAGGADGSARERSRAGGRLRGKGFDFFGTAARPRRVPGAPSSGPVTSENPEGDPAGSEADPDP
ncbi:cell division protein ZapB, partial [Streptomyces alkaliphilus]|uniref:cell division protein ZapB n=1 Tax=Streptomyces alkaliphilus TaxID=1472722 RepID=UPI00117D6F9E